LIRKEASRWPAQIELLAALQEIDQRLQKEGAYARRASPADNGYSYSKSITKNVKLKNNGNVSRNQNFARRLLESISYAKKKKNQRETSSS
jgi:hypothetical protein